MGVPRGGCPPGYPCGGRGAALHLTLDQDRRVSGGLRLLLAIRERRERRQGDQIDGRAQRAAIGGAGEGCRLAAVLHGRGEIGRANVCTSVTNARLVCSFLFAKKKTRKSHIITTQ